MVQNTLLFIHLLFLLQVLAIRILKFQWDYKYVILEPIWFILYQIHYPGLKIFLRIIRIYPQQCIGIIKESLQTKKDNPPFKSPLSSESELVSYPCMIVLIS